MIIYLYLVFVRMHLNTAFVLGLPSLKKKGEDSWESGVHNVWIIVLALTGPGCSERLWCFHPWGRSYFDWLLSCLTWSISALERGLAFWGSLPTLIILLWYNETMLLSIFTLAVVSYKSALLSHIYCLQKHLLFACISLTDILLPLTWTEVHSVLDCTVNMLLPEASSS